MTINLMTENSLLRLQFPNSEALIRSDMDKSFKQYTMILSYYVKKHMTGLSVRVKLLKKLTND
jgi:hypothetical protein